MNPIPCFRQNIISTVILLAFLIASLTAIERVRAAESVSDKVGAVTTEAGKEIQDATKTTEIKIQELWRRIDEKRLKNRTPDQLVSWVIMGLLVGGLIHQFSNLKKTTTVLLGLGGAFIGGIAANVAGLNIGLGPVLISYEELLASLLGGVLIVLIARWFASRRPQPK